MISSGTLSRRYTDRGSQGKSDGFFQIRQRIPQSHKKQPAGNIHSRRAAVLYYFLIKILILIRKASPDGAACFVIYKERNHKTSLI